MSQSIDHDALATYVVSLLSLPELKAMAHTFLHRCYMKDNGRALNHAADYGWHGISEEERRKHVLDLDLLDEMEECILALENEYEKE